MKFVCKVYKKEANARKKYEKILEWNKRVNPIFEKICLKIEENKEFGRWLVSWSQDDRKWYEIEENEYEWKKEGV